eukprot:941255-Ditylum_brightwellii.AAC.1
MEQKEEELISSMKQELMDLILPQARMIVMEEIAQEQQSKKQYGNHQMEYNKNENEEECDTKKDLIKDG